MAGLGVNISVTAQRSGQRSQRKAKGDGHLRRAEILLAAERIFIACGYEGATIRRIADEVGVSSTALYMHFRDKSEILVEICAGAFSRLIASNTELSRREMDPVHRVRAMLEAYVAFGFNNPNAYQLMFCAISAEIPDDKLTALTELGAQCYDLFSGAVDKIKEAGRLKVDDIHGVAQVLWTAPHGLIDLVLGRPNFSWVERDALVRLMLDGLFEGLTRP